MTGPETAPKKPARLRFLASLAILFASCTSRERATRDRGPWFHSGALAAGWTLACDPACFRLTPPLCPPGDEAIRKWKAMELTNVRQRAAMEVYLVRPREADIPAVARLLLRESQRRGLVEGPVHCVSVGGRAAEASIAAWRPTREAPCHYFYLVIVPLPDALWCFVGSAPRETFRPARRDFAAFLRSVRFHPTPTARRQLARPRNR